MIDWSGLGYLKFELPKIDPELERIKQFLYSGHFHTLIFSTQGRRTSHLDIRSSLTVKRQLLSLISMPENESDIVNGLEHSCEALHHISKVQIFSSNLVMTTDAGSLYHSAVSQSV